ncbi:SAM-dependent methyltransferase [Amycolatopsis sp. 195334CR]|uniref:SAM-dependent methyltransferase n=1 Tax=Amycolatopsis sp. 195334CR TaxID=2814588 RepID=UPI001A8D44F7|nr:SAM-dependent methyltransferase [Amycolatopsis sp. 195334CR]MBN6040838.1 SAM-dependent methyltransferase [Amycolatopsis sp. 195334CR]
MVDWTAAGVDVTKPALARVYDYMLGGSLNFPEDRALAERIAKVGPFREMARLNRHFLRRAVRFCVESGVHQFLDLGSGIPASGNVHEIAQESNRESRVVYVDHDPIAVAHSEVLLADNPHATVLRADLRDAEAVVSHPETRALLDFGRPIALFLLGVVQYIPDSGNPAGLIARYADAVAPGSLLAMTHFTSRNMEEEMAAAVEYFAETAAPITLRSAEQITGLLGALEPVVPGVVLTAKWRPELGGPPAADPERSGHYAVVARKR